MISSTNKTALITGASAGIGTEFARQLAAQGFNLVLTARRLDRLQTLATDLQEQHSIQTHCISADLANPDAINQIITELNTKKITIHTLINNAGYGVPGYLTTVEWKQHQDFMRVMVDAVVELCYHLLPSMHALKEGQIINVASLAGVVPGSASHTLYPASKAFLIKFSESLALENATTGVRVQALCPGFTLSEFHDVLGTREQVSKMPSYMWMTAEQVVSESLREIEKENYLPMQISGKVNRFIARLSRWLPQRTALAMIKKNSKKYRAQVD